MTNAPKPHPLSPKRSRAVLRYSPIAAACSTVLLAAGAAQAQQAQPADAQTVVVTGMRRSIESSIAVKRNADSIVEAISAEDLGKLPDQSIADALARLPGLAGQRVGGRTQTISIRGLGPDFAGTLLNGRQQVTTGDNRSVEYDQFPSELINGAVVYKTPTATVIGQGLSGTIDLKSIRPLDYRGRQIALNARVESNSQGQLNANTKTQGNRFSASYVDQFADNTIGLALGAAHLDTPVQQLHYKAWGFSTFPSTCRADWGCGQPSGGPTGSTYLNGYEATAVSSSQKRDGLMAVLEYKPNKDVHSTLDLYYSKFKKDETMRGLMGGLGENWNGVPGVAYTNVVTTPVGGSTTLVTQANLANVVQVVRNDLNTRDDTLKSAGWNTLVKLGGGWSAVADLSYSSARRDENVIETYAGPYAGAAKQTGTFAINIPTGSGFPSLVPGLNYADVNNVKLSDPAVWSHDALWKKPVMSDEIKALRLEGRRELGGMFSGVDFGVDYTRRQKDRQMNEQTANLKNARAPVGVSSDLLQPATSLAFAGIPSVLAYDVLGVLGKYYDVAPTAEGEIINRNYEVSEKVSTAYVKLSMDTTWGVPVTGNLGLQLVHSDQSSHGFSSVGGTVSETTRGTTYDDVLPSLNLSFDLGSNMLLRAGIAKTLARGRMDDMRAGASASVSATSHLWSGSGGNPQLEPWRATSYDLSFEKYLGKRSYVAVAGFYKQLDTYIYTQTLPYDFTGIPNTSGNVASSPIGLFTRPVNGQGGHVSGVELTGSIDGGLFSKSLDGIGLIASASVNESNLQPSGPGAPEKLPGLSRVVTSLTAYYEVNGFSARISHRYRSAFRGEITGLHNARSFDEILADRQVELQLGYEFQSGSLKGLGVLFQVNNLTDSPYATRQGNGFGDVIAPLEYNKYGRQYLFGVNYKL
ncbi:MAG: TonB-dependent receptor [Rubrivivax sp.]|nr:TonB-dependent receptor [Rubrivivax sp.]